MGTQKDALIDAEENWIALARSKGWKCKLCGEVILKEWWHTYQETGYCSSCAHMVEKE